MTSEEQLTIILKYLPTNLTWNPHALFVIYVDRFLDETDDFDEKIIAGFWSLLTIDIVIIVPNMDYTDSV